MQIKIKGKLPENPTTDDVINLILENRHISGAQHDVNNKQNDPDYKVAKNKQSNVLDYFNPPHPASLSLSDFGFEKQYIEDAMELIWSLHGKDNPIVVYSDYDADGITGGAVLWETLHTLGFKAFPYIGNRVEEGYGFSKTGLDKVKKKYDPALIISVDHGIVAKEMVRYAKYELGIPVIVTDHHHRQEDKVPTDAEAVFHIPVLSGSATAYYVAKEICEHSRQFLINNKQKNSSKNTAHISQSTYNTLSQLFQSDYIGLASIGTIADLVPLVGPSRAIAKYGLESLTKTKRAGIEALKAVSGNLGKTITTYEVGFMIAPRINASGRLSDALTALRLLCTRDVSKANAIAQKLQALNIERQDMVNQAVDEAISIVEKMRDKNGNLPKILIVHQDDIHTATQYVNSDKENNASHISQTKVDNHTLCEPWHEGIIGLIASKLVERYYRPAIVLTKQAHTTKVSMQGEENNNENNAIHGSQSINHYSFKASARSIYGLHLTDFLKNFAEYLSHFGGHSAAAGLSISGENLPIFIENATSLSKTLITDEMLIPTIEVDCQLPINCANHELVRKIALLEPFGVGNEKPKFVSSGYVSNLQIFGKDNNHLRFNLVSKEGYAIPFIAFGKANLASELSDQKEISLAYTLDINRWNGSEKPQAKFITLA